MPVERHGISVLQPDELPCAGDAAQGVERRAEALQKFVREPPGTLRIGRE